MILGEAKTILKYVAIIIACGTLIVLAVCIKGCSSNPITLRSIQVPRDSNFTPIVRGSYRPPSTPFSKKKLPVDLPSGIRERDVKQVITIGFDTSSHRPPKTVDIIETKTGEVFVLKDSAIKSVSVTVIEAPIFAVDLRFGVGLSIGVNGESHIHVSPAAIMAPFEWSGWLQAPIVVADLDGVGVGAQMRFYHDVYVGASRIWRYDLGTQAKINLNFVL